MDFLYAGLALAFFALSLWLVAAAERLRPPR